MPFSIHKKEGLSLGVEEAIVGWLLFFGAGGIGVQCLFILFPVLH